MKIYKPVLIALASIACGLAIALLLGDAVSLAPKAIVVALGSGLGAWAAVSATRPK